MVTITRVSGVSMVGIVDRTRVGWVFGKVERGFLWVVVVVVFVVFHHRTP